MTTPRHFTFDGHGLNDVDNEYKERVLTFAKGQNGEYLLGSKQRQAVADLIVRAVDAYDALVAALKAASLLLHRKNLSVQDEQEALDMIQAALKGADDGEAK